MPFDFKCVCGTTVQVPDRFAGEKIECPVCNRIMTMAQSRPKPWWENHQESIKKIISVPPAHPQPVGRPGYRAGEPDKELEGFETKASDGDLKASGSIKRGTSEESSNLKRKGSWKKWAKISLLSLIILLFGPFRVSFIMRPKGPEVERTGERGAIRRTISHQEELPESEVREESEKGELLIEGNLNVPPAPGESKEEGPTIDSSSDKATKPKENASAFSPDRQVANGERIERPEEEPGKQKGQLELAMKSPIAAKTYTVNVGSFREKAKADRYVEELRERGFGAFEWEIEHAQKGKWYRVSIGNFSSLKQAQHFAKDLEEKGFKIFVVRLLVDQNPPNRSESNTEEKSKPADQDRGPRQIQDMRRLLRS